jgi:hypothetical protein
MAFSPEFYHINIVITAVREYWIDNYQQAYMLYPLMSQTDFWTADIKERI